MPAVAEALREEGRVLDDAGLWQLVEQVRSDLVGFGPLDGWIDAPGVTDVLINGPSEIWIDRGGGLERLDDQVPRRGRSPQVAPASGQQCGSPHR